MQRAMVLASWLLSAFVLAGASAVAQGPPPAAGPKPLEPPSKITVKVEGLSCSTTLGAGTFRALSYSWGANNVGSDPGGGGGGAGKANISDLNVLRRLDACSPALFGAVVVGKHFTTVTLAHLDANDNLLLTITLSDALVSSWTISGAESDAAPVESVSFNFAKVCIAEPSGGGRFCFDRTEERPF